ncbi:MAG: hypothetical protein ACRDN0_12830 [Trebonia sp.]
MGNREEGVRVRGQDRLLFVQVGGADGDDRARGRGLVAVALDIGLAEGAFPGERLAPGFPGQAGLAVLVHAFGDLGQREGEAGHVSERLHDSIR